jgi:hypothetical protein
MPILTDPSDRGGLALVSSVAVLMAGVASLSHADSPSAHSNQPTYPSAEDAAGAL